MQFYTPRYTLISIIVFSASLHGMDPHHTDIVKITIETNSSEDINNVIEADTLYLYPIDEYICTETFDGSLPCKFRDFYKRKLTTINVCDLSDRWNPKKDTATQHINLIYTPDETIPLNENKKVSFFGCRIMQVGSKIIVTEQTKINNVAKTLNFEYETPATHEAHQNNDIENFSKEIKYLHELVTENHKPSVTINRNLEWLFFNNGLPTVYWLAKYYLPDLP